MEETESGDILDDWFIDSLKMYKDLYVYQLEHPTQVIEWTSANSVCVAGNSSSKSEILELRLPPKLFAAENKGLCAERDFKVVHGGFADGPVRRLTHVPGTRCVVTNDGLSSELQVWELAGGDSDGIRRSGSVWGRRRGRGSEGGSRIAARCSATPQVLHGAVSGDVQLTELTSGQPLFTLDGDSADPLTSLQFVSDAVFLAGCRNGNVFVADIRTTATPQLSPSPDSADHDALWWADASVRPSGCRMIRLSSSGLMVVSDLRNLGGAVSRAQLDVQTGRRDSDDVRVSWAPTLDDYIAVSGFGGAVQIFDTSAWGAEQQDARPLFEHRGHAVVSDGCPPVVVTAHIWHPEKPQTLLSAASDSSVHVWDWINQSAGS